jgi:hypothetical protein
MLPGMWRNLINDSLKWSSPNSFIYSFWYQNSVHLNGTWTGTRYGSTFDILFGIKTPSNLTELGPVPGMVRPSTPGRRRNQESTLLASTNKVLTPASNHARALRTHHSEGVRPSTSQVPDS